MRNSHALSLVLALLASPLATAFAAPADVIAIADVKRDGAVDFEKEVLPILRNKCLACHNTTEAESDLVLETPQTILKGGGEGPSVVPGQTRVPYFVRVLGSSGQVVQGQDFTADFKLSSANPRGQSQEELNLTLPFNQISELGSYRIAVGLKPTMEELDYNRRAGQR